MARDRLSAKIEELFQKGDWVAARARLERERERAPLDHWLLTQLGVTFYEQKRYEEALPLFEESLKLVPDCPLTLWNVAGTLDAMGKSDDAVRIYTRLLERQTPFPSDPCWESQEWTEELKTDAVYRLGICFEHLAKKRTAELCYRQYLNLLLAGITGSDSLDDVSRRIQGLLAPKNPAESEAELEKAVEATLKAVGMRPRKNRRPAPPKLRVG